MTALLVFLLLGYSPENKLDLNRATLDQLLELPVCAEVAEEIHEYLVEYGRFESVYDLTDVPGVDSRLLEQLKPLVKVSQPEEDEVRLRKVHLIQRRLASEEGPTSAAVEQWQDLLITPLNINRAKVADLYGLDNVSLVDAVSVVKHLRTGDRIGSRRDLASRVQGLSSYGYRNIRDFIAYDDVAWTGFGGNVRTEYDSDTWWEYSAGTEQFSSALAVLDEDSVQFREAGFTQAEMDFYRARLTEEQAFVAGIEGRGDVRNRVRARWGRHFAVGGWLNHRLFEPGVLNGYKGFVEARDLGPLDRLYVGDFRVTLGQGLLLDNNAELRSRVHERPEGIFHDMSENPNFGFRGAAASLEYSRFGLLGFYAMNRRDAILNPDSTVNWYITTTPRYPTFKDVLGETDYGGSARFDLGDLGFVPTGTRLAANFLGIGWDREFRPDVKYVDIPGDATVIDDPNYLGLGSGKGRMFYGADFRTVIENVSLEGELAMKHGTHNSVLADSGMQMAYVAKARAQYDYLYVTALYRHYDIGYDNPYNRGYTEQLRLEDTPFEKDYRLLDPSYAALQDYPMPKAEEGFLLETRYQISRQVTFTRAYIDLWRNLAWGVNNVRFQGEVEWRPVYPLRLRFKQKLQSKGLPKPVLSSRSFTMETSLRAMASLTDWDFLSAELREGRIFLTPNLEFGDKASMSGNFLAVQWDHNFSDDLNTELGVAVWLSRGMSHWIFEDAGIDFLEGDGLKWYLAVSDRVSENLMVYFKVRQEVSLFPHTGLGGREGIHYPGTTEPVRDFMGRADDFGVSVQVDLFW